MDTGNTNEVINCCHQQPVHPRGYGEHTANAKAVVKANGSSPWIRGTHITKFGSDGEIRFIPVDTGNTKTPTVTRAMLAVHPRGYGEHLRFNLLGSV